jgi:nitrilase
LLRRDEIPASMPHADLLRAALPQSMAAGGTCVAGPDGEWLVPPCSDEERLVLGNLDPVRIRAERQSFDPFGHHSRPDVFELQVNRLRLLGARFDDDGAARD